MYERGLLESETWRDVARHAEVRVLADHENDTNVMMMMVVVVVITIMIMVLRMTVIGDRDCNCVDDDGKKVY